MTSAHTKIVAGMALAALLGAGSLWAHHAFSAEFDAKRPVQLKGTVAKMEWINPHAWIHIDVTVDGGEVQRWMIEGGTPNTLFRRGFTKNSLLPGTVIIVDGYQAKDGTLKANGRDLTFEDGSKLFMGSSERGHHGTAGTRPSRKGERTRFPLESQTLVERDPTARESHAEPECEDVRATSLPQTGPTWPGRHRQHACAG